MANPFPGRRESIGFGKEPTPGTSVAPSFWLPHLSLTFNPKTKKIDNTSALGRLENINDSAIVSQWSEGSLNGKVTDTAIGLLLLNLLGSEASAVKETTAYNHTFTVNNSSRPPSLTFGRVNPVETLRYALGELTDFELDVKQEDWATFTSSVTAKIGATAADTASYPAPAENEFTSKHTSVKIASTTGGLSGATAADIKSLKLKISQKNDKWVPFGAIDPTSFDPQDFEVTGEIVLRYTDTTYEALGNANTRQAMSISLVNTDVTIGATSNPALVFTMPKVRFAPLTLDNNLNQVISQTVTFNAELDTTAGAMLTAVLTNTRSTAY